jgi:biopolymer transport protein ExbD
MAGRHSKRGKAHKIETPDLELMPLLNVFISIIPMLLLSAAFVQLAVIPTGLPAAAAAAAPVSKAEEERPLDLTIVIRADAYVLEGAGLETRTFPRTAGSTPATDSGRAQLSETLRALAAQHEKKGEVRIVPAVKTRYEEIIDVMDLARAAGLSNAALADADTGTV